MSTSSVSIVDAPCAMAGKRSWPSGAMKVMSSDIVFGVVGVTISIDAADRCTDSPQGRGWRATDEGDDGESGKTKATSITAPINDLLPNDSVPTCPVPVEINVLKGIPPSEDCENSITFPISRCLLRT